MAKDGGGERVEYQRQSRRSKGGQNQKSIEDLRLYAPKGCQFGGGTESATKLRCYHRAPGGGGTFPPRKVRRQRQKISNHVAVGIKKIKVTPKERQKIVALGRLSAPPRRKVLQHRHWAAQRRKREKGGTNLRVTAGKGWC